MNDQRWHPCACCGAPTWDALCGNRFLLRSDVARLPTEQVSPLSWRCGNHQPYQIRQAAAMRASELGDLISTLTCGHDVQWLCRGRRAYTLTLVTRCLVTRQIRLDQPQRYYRCADVDTQESESKP